MTGQVIAPPLSTSGRFVVDATGRRVHLAGVNWYGAHEDDGVAPGLDRVHRTELAATIARLGFNSVRLPFSLWMTRQTAPVPDPYLAANPDLSGSSPLQVYDACVEALTAAGLIVILNCHTLDAGWCCSQDDGNGLWYNQRWPAETFLAIWRDMAARYVSNPGVAGLDIMNEPRQARVGWRVLTPTWGSRRKTDIAAMYTEVGNTVHEVSPDLLIICEGVGFAADLAGAARRPVELKRPGKVVYSLHDYPWFHPRGQARAAYFDEMTRHGGYLLRDQIAPLWIGEFGTDTRSLASFGRAPGGSDAAVWWGNAEAWITEYDVDWCWWPLNPTQPAGTIPGTGRRRSSWGDPEPWGLLADDWRGVRNPAVLDILQSMIPPRTGPDEG
jgi:endoglucanase